MGFLRSLKNAWDEVPAETLPDEASVSLPPQGSKGSLPCRSSHLSRRATILATPNSAPI